MRVRVLGMGDVGGRLGSKLVALGHEVKMGSGTALNEGGPRHGGVQKVK